VTIDVGGTSNEAKALLIRGSRPWRSSMGSRTSTSRAPDGVGGRAVETFEGHVRSMCEQMARISIEPRWARFDDVGAGRIPACLSKLASRADAE
jgi:hypothetical protein